MWCVNAWIFFKDHAFLYRYILLFHFGLTEFDNWYAESFLNQTDDISSSAAGHGMRPGVILPFNPNQVVSY